MTYVLPGHFNNLNAARELVLAILRPYTKGSPVPTDGGYNGAGCGVLIQAPRRTDGILLHADQRT